MLQYDGSCTGLVRHTSCALPDTHSQNTSISCTSRQREGFDHQTSATAWHANLLERCGMHVHWAHMPRKGATDCMAFIHMLSRSTRMHVAHRREWTHLREPAHVERSWGPHNVSPCSMRHLSCQDMASRHVTHVHKSGGLNHHRYAAFQHSLQCAGNESDKNLSVKVTRGWRHSTAKSPSKQSFTFACPSCSGHMHEHTHVHAEGIALPAL